MTELVSRSLRAAGPALLVAACLSLPTDALAGVAEANACAATLSKDARAIFDATLPQLTPQANLRELLTTNTRDLAFGGTISLWNARESATAASDCLQKARD